MIALETCDQCGKDFVPKHRRQRTCSRECYKALYYRENLDAIKLREKARRDKIQPQINAKEKAKYRNDPLYREEKRRLNKARAAARHAKFIAMGLNAHGKPRSKMGRKPKTNSP